MVQRQLANFQTSFQQQIAALEAALGASIIATNSVAPSVLPMYLENPVTSFSNLIVTNYLFGSMGNSIGVIGREKLNDQNFPRGLNP